MERPKPRQCFASATGASIGVWPDFREGETARVEVRTMRLLLCLAGHAGESQASDDLLYQVCRMSASLRLGLPGGDLSRVARDDPKQPLISKRCRAGVSDGGDG